MISNNKYVDVNNMLEIFLFDKIYIYEIHKAPCFNAIFHTKPNNYNANEWMKCKSILNPPSLIIKSQLHLSMNPMTFKLRYLRRIKNFTLK